MTFQARFNSALLSLAADFTGTYSPCQGVEIAPLSGGVSVAATNRGAITFIGWDPAGTVSGRRVLLPSKDLAAACRGIKTAERDVVIEGDLAKVTTYHKAHSTAKEFPVVFTSTPFPPLAEVLTKAIEYWGATPEMGRTAGRYDLGLLVKALKALGTEDDAVCLSAWQGGPLRLQRDDVQAVVLLMPQEAKPLPSVPPWLENYAQQAQDAACVLT